VVGGAVVDALAAPFKGNRLCEHPRCVRLDQRKIPMRPPPPWINNALFLPARVVAVESGGILVSRRRGEERLLLIQGRASALFAWPPRWGQERRREIVYLAALALCSSSPSSSPSSLFSAVAFFMGEASAPERCRAVALRLLRERRRQLQCRHTV
jgi:hypothetical protein